MPRKRSGSYFVGDKAFPSPGAALSAAQNLAVQWCAGGAGEEEVRSFYVRDALDNALYRVDREEGGVVLTYPL